MPNGLLVNDVNREQTIQKYLIKEAKSGQNSKTDNIKNKLCLDYLLNLYKSTVIKKVTEFSPHNDDNISIDDNLNEFIQICEKVIEKTCSTLTSVKRVFNLNPQLSPSVFAMMKSLLKSYDEDENVPDQSKKSKIVKISKASQSITPNTRSLRSEKKQNGDSSILKSPKSSLSANVLPSTKLIDKDVKIVLERLDDSILAKKMGNKLSKANTEVSKDEIHILSDSSSNSEEEITRKLRSRKVKKINEKVKYILNYLMIKLIF